MKWMALISATILFAGTVVAQNRPYGPPPPPHSGDPWVYGPQGPGNWDQSWNNRPNPQRGACFFSDFNFQGNHFCVRSGDQLGKLPGGMGDHISSIKVFGGAQVTVYNDGNFQNGSTHLRGSVADLRRIPFRDGHTWNDRISSVTVR